MFKKAIWLLNECMFQMSYLLWVWNNEHFAHSLWNHSFSVQAFLQTQTLTSELEIGKLIRMKNLVRLAEWGKQPELQVVVCYSASICFPALETESICGNLTDLWKCSRPRSACIFLQKDITYPLGRRMHWKQWFKHQFPWPVL